MKIRPAHHALLCYAEWCCDNRLAWPKMKIVAADLARDERDLRQAFEQLMEWGLISIRYCGPAQQRMVRLGDGRETGANKTRTYPQDIDVIRFIHRRGFSLRSDIIAHEKTRVAA